MSGDIAEAIQGRLAGAIKQWDENDELTEQEINRLSGRCAGMIEGELVARSSKGRLARLRGEESDDE